jgi:WD40 repeat protein
VAFSPDGAMLATTGDDGWLKIWRPSTGQLLATLSGEGPAWGPSFSADGSRVAGAWRRDSPSVRVLDLPAGRVVWSHPIPEAADTALSPHGDRIAVASDESGAVFDLETGEREFPLPGMESRPELPGQVGWSPDGRYVATASLFGGVRIYAETGRFLSELSGHRFVTGLDWSPRSPSPGSVRLVTGGSEGIAKVWEVRTSGVEEVLSLAAPEMHCGVEGLAFSKDGTRVMAGDCDRTAVKVWDVGPNGDVEWGNFPSSGQRGTGFASDGRTVVTTTADGDVVSLWDVEARRQVRTIDPTTIGLITAVDVSPDGTAIAAGGAGVGRIGGEVAGVWDAATGEELFLVRHRLGIVDVAFGRDGQHLVTASWDGSAKVADRSGRVVRVVTEDDVIRGSEDDGYVISEARLSSDGRLIATAASWRGASRPGGRNPHVRIWDLESGAVIQTIEGAESVDFDPTGSRMVVTFAQRAEIWDVRRLAPIAVLVPPAQDIRVVAFSPDGSLLAAGLDDGTIQLHDADTGERHLVLSGTIGHPCAISGLAFSPDGSKLASNSECKEVRIWALDLDDLIRIARRNVTRSLTDAECLQYLHRNRCPPS